MTMLSIPQTGRCRETYVSVGYHPGPTPSTQFSLRATEIATTALLASAYTALRCTVTAVLSSRIVPSLCTPVNVDNAGSMPRYWAAMDGHERSRIRAYAVRRIDCETSGSRDSLMTYGRMTVSHVACSYRCATLAYRFSDCSRAIEGYKHPRPARAAVSKQLRRLCKRRGHDGGA